VDTLTIVLIASALVAGAAVVVLLARVLRELHELKRPEDASGLLVLQTQLDALREQLTTSLSGNRMEIDRRLEETNRVVGDVRRGLGEVDQQVRAVSAAARDLRGLQELLRSPTARGGMGEFLLNELLEQVLPRAHFELQHEFDGGERVDAVLRLGDGLVPVDAKFPLENFRRLRQAGAEQNEAEERAARRGFRADVKRHVDAISHRYIRTEEGTFDFALMYIPAEAVYQEVLQQETEDGLDLFHFALQKKVVPVSPQSFYAYLQVILLGLRGMSIEERAQEIMRRLGAIQHRLSLFTDSFDLVGKHLGNAQRQMDEAGRRLNRLDAAVGELAAEPPSDEPAPQLDPPTRSLSDH
jgi:DNA recombination protein RmuC